MDIPSIATILTSAIEITKHIKNSDNSLEKAERDLKLAEVINSVVDAKVEISNIQQQLLEKDEQIRNLNEQIAIKGKLQYEPPYYWLVEDENKDGPFCQSCYDKDNKFIRLHETYDNKGVWNCKVCKNTYISSTFNI